MIENLPILTDEVSATFMPDCNIALEVNALSDYANLSESFTVNPNEDFNADFLSGMEAVMKELASVVFEKITYRDDPKYYHQLVKIVGGYLVNKDIKQQFKLLSNLLTKLSKKYNKKANSILHNITLLFGLCSHKLSYIFNAFFGTTSARIFSF